MLFEPAGSSALTVAFWESCWFPSESCSAVESLASLPVWNSQGYYMVQCFKHRLSFGGFACCQSWLVSFYTFLPCKFIEFSRDLLKSWLKQGSGPASRESECVDLAPGICTFIMPLTGSEARVWAMEALPRGQTLRLMGPLHREWAQPAKGQGPAPRRETGQKHQALAAGPVLLAAKTETREGNWGNLPKCLL